MSLPRIWPDGTQAAVTVTVNVDGESLEHKTMPLPLWGRYSYGRYGAQLGAQRLLALVARYGVRATFFIGGWDAERYPELMAAIQAAGHEVAGYGYGHEDFSALSTAEQAAVLERSEATFQQVFGGKPAGFRAPEGLMTAATRGLLASRGYRYDSSYCDDDLPYVVQADQGARLVELPVHDPSMDKNYYAKYRMPSVVQHALIDEFEATYSEGGLFNLVLHPRGDYGSGREVRIPAAEAVLRRIQEYPNVWSATCGEVANWMLEKSGNSGS
jgi:peptidoglycan/xylan/chitin deacetylase (PgdA/CDA1 family)